ncbi:MAG: hypothetical protein AAGF97_09785 [Planctomycetota bacterium]
MQHSADGALTAREDTKAMIGNTMSLTKIGPCGACRLVAWALVLLWCAPLAAQQNREVNLTGDYTLISVEGEKLPMAILSEDQQIEVREGSLTLDADGTCRCKTIVRPPSRVDATREVTGRFTRDGSKLLMQWDDAQFTEATVMGELVMMKNHGALFTYQRRPSVKLLDRFLGTWRSVQVQGPNVGEAVELTYRRHLGGQFVQEVGAVDGKEVAMIMYGYDTKQNIFRLWRFSAVEAPTTATGQWDANRKTFEWNYAANPDEDFTMTARYQFLNDDAFVWEVVGRNRGDEVVFRLVGEADRTDPGKP